MASKVVLRKDGSSTLGESESVLGVGPKAPATKRGCSGFFSVHSSQTRRAMRADSRFSSWTRSSVP